MNRISSRLRRSQELFVQAPWLELALITGKSPIWHSRPPPYGKKHVTPSANSKREALNLHLVASHDGKERPESMVSEVVVPFCADRCMQRVRLYLIHVGAKFFGPSL